MTSCQAVMGSWLVIRCPAGDCATIAERERRATSIALFDDLHEITALRCGEPVRPPVSGPQSSRINNWVLVMLRKSLGKLPSPWASSSSSKRRGMRLQSTVTPSRQAACARAQPSPGLSDAAGAPRCLGGDDQVALVGDPLAGEPGFGTAPCRGRAGRGSIDILRAGAQGVPPRSG